MYRAYLRVADLSKANLGDADLFGAYLSEAELFGVDLSGANLHGARLEHASFNENTTLSDGTKGKPDTDLSRFTDSDHPDFWRSDGPDSPAYRGKDGEQ
jgi:uncharacterized protein YjbI with pentapeptide repeats